MRAQFRGLKDSIEDMLPSEWAEKNRYLPPSVTPLPGFYRYDVGPFLREIVDCFCHRSPVREISVMKGAQIGATTGIMETAIGYAACYESSVPIIMMSADAELADQRIEVNILPMMQQSGLDKLIQSSDVGNQRKTGKTKERIEWIGGGFLMPYGAKNANKMRQVSAQHLHQDECDSYADTVGKDGDPSKLIEARTKAFHQTRKIGRYSTPLIKGQSRIEKYFKEGDQRKFFVPCKKCGFKQWLKFQGKNKETGVKYGLTWSMDGATLRESSVRYLCYNCGFPHRNSDKAWMFSRGQWIPTAKAKKAGARSYHIPALYSPSTMYPWEAMVQTYLDAWDVEANRVKDVGALQEFYNNDLGEPFEVRGNKLKFTALSGHRRNAYLKGEIPNEHAIAYGESRILVITCAVDVHDDNLAVSVFGWTRGGRAYLIDYWTFEGDALDLENDETWGALRALIESKRYISDDNYQYGISITLVDAGHNNELVISFCSEYESGVFPILGRDTPSKNQTIKEFSQWSTKLGTEGYKLTVDLYKDRWSSALRRNWDGIRTQPKGHFNAPLDTTDKQLKELTTEYKREKIEKSTGKRVGFEWYRPSGRPNELWDTLVYNSAALDLLAWDVCCNQRDMDAVDWNEFYTYLENEHLFFSKI